MSKLNQASSTTAEADTTADGIKCVVDAGTDRLAIAVGIHIRRAPVHFFGFSAGGQVLLKHHDKTVV